MKKSKRKLTVAIEKLLSSPLLLRGVRVTRSLVICVFCRSLFVRLSFFFWPLCYLSFFDLRILITPLVSSNSADPVHKLPLPRIRILCINPDAVPTIRNHTTNMTLGLLVLLWNKKCFPIFCLMFLEPLFVYLSFFLLAILFFLSFYDLRCLFTPFGIFKKSLKIPKG